MIAVMAAAAFFGGAVGGGVAVYVTASAASSGNQCAELAEALGVGPKAKEEYKKHLEMIESIRRKQDEAVILMEKNAKGAR
ncbi:hypothetical protein [Pelomicrobium methylotrophicum]|nr:hypothetical protein [Pelomicrobium methylotrophicum]